jgi:hypothetical protein
MPDIEEIIETLAPFAFVLIWIFSAVVGRAKEKPPAKTSRPIFGPVAENPARNRGPDQATVKPAPDQMADWRGVEEVSPYQSTDYETERRSREAAAKLKEQLSRAMRERERREDARAKREAAADRKSVDEAAKNQVFKTNKPVNLSHLVSDHAAEMHLEHALTDKAAVSTKSGRKGTILAASVISGMQDRDSVRKALIMSIVLSEPRSKSKHQKPL